MLKKGVIALIALSVLSVSALLGAENASAISAYDNVIKSTDVISLVENDCSFNNLKNMWSVPFDNASREFPTLDGGNYRGIVKDENNNDVHYFFGSGSTVINQPVLDLWQNKEQWYVLKSPGENAIKVFFTDDPNYKFEFVQAWGEPALIGYGNAGYMQGGFTIRIMPPDQTGGVGCSLKIETGQPVSVPTDPNNLNQTWVTSQADNKMFWFLNGDVTYPTEYSGITPVNSAPVESTDLTPDLNDDISLWYEEKGKVLTLVHKTTIPPLDLSSMVCRYYISNDNADNPTILMDKVTSCEESNFQQVTVPENGLYWYELEILYDINDDGVILPTESIGKIKNNVNMDGKPSNGMVGSTWSDDTDFDNVLLHCLKVEFPFVDLENCVESFNVILGMLSFGVINNNASVLGVASTADADNCHALGTLGNWIYKPGEVICSAFPSEIRNIITPFITFILGGLVFFWVSRGKGVIIE